MDEFVAVLLKLRPRLVRGYPAALEIMARHLSRREIHGLGVRAVQTSSEVVLTHQREAIEAGFGAPLFDWYGHGESTVGGGECAYHRGLHLNLELGVHELVHEDAVLDSVDTKSLVGTSLCNYSMPLIRYDTEDLVELAEGSCECGRELPRLKRIVGRQADMILGVNGVRLSPSSTIHYWKHEIAPGLAGVRYAQIVQESHCTIVVRLAAPQNRRNEELIQGKLRELLGYMDISFVYLSRIPTEDKWRFTVSRLTNSRAI